MSHNGLINEVYGPGDRVPTQEQETLLERKIEAILSIIALLGIISVGWGTVIIEIMHLRLLGGQ